VFELEQKMQARYTHASGDKAAIITQKDDSFCRVCICFFFLQWLRDGFAACGFRRLALQDLPSQKAAMLLEDMDSLLEGTKRSTIKKHQSPLSLLETCHAIAYNTRIKAKCSKQENCTWLGRCGGLGQNLQIKSKWDSNRKRKTFAENCKVEHTFIYQRL
jgi:hypothetical protein